MLRILPLFILLAVVTAVPFTDVSGTTQSWTFRIDPSEVTYREPEPGKVMILVDGYNTFNYLDYPPIPYRVFSVLVPQGDEVTSVSLVVDEKLELDPSIPLALFEGDYLDDGSKMGVVTHREEVATGASIFPRWQVRHLGSSYHRGYRIATFAIYPIRYNLDSGRLILEKEVTVTVETGPAPIDTERLERMRYVPGFRERARIEAESKVINPELAITYNFNEVAAEKTQKGFMPTYFPSLEGSEVSFVIVTNEEMAPAFQILADWKTKKGVPAVVRTVEWISQNYRSGADMGESVRIFIQEAYAKWGVNWVMLGGDSDVIPARLAYCTFYTGDFIPTDMYYSCLDGTWNDDRDSLWGEAYHSAWDPGDDVDLYSEVYLGRMPASDYYEAEILVNKVINYATPADTQSKDKFLILAEVIFPSDYNPGDDIILDGAEISEDVYLSHLIGNPDVTTLRLYETCQLYSGTVCLTVEESLDSLNAGANHVMHIGHGYKYNMSVGNGNILNYDASNLTNGDALFAMYLMNCTNVAFDTDCLAEYFLLNPDGGAFAVTGASRSAFPSASRPYLNYYYELLYVDNEVRLGTLYTKSREPFTPSAYGETADRWTHYIYNYLGDPEVNIFQGETKTFTANIPASAGFGPNDISVQVQSGGSPYESALVCLYKEGDDYVYDYTDATGTILFEDFNCKMDGVIGVTVTGRNHCRYVDTIQVLEESNPFLRVQNTAIDDNIIGNGDDILDAGEMVSLHIKLRNTGQSGATKLYAIIRSDDPEVSISDSVGLYPDIPSGTEAYGLDGFAFSVGSNVVDEHPVEFTIDIHDSMGGFWSEQFAYEVRAPEIELFVNILSDTIPYGNNNGVIENGETFLIKIGVKNFGTGTAYGLQGKVRSLDGDIVIDDSMAVYNDAPTLGVVYGDGFVMTESDIMDINYYTFELTDAYDRTFSKQMELRVPGEPHTVVLDASFGPTEIHLTWRPPDTLDSYRYLVYHSLDPGGPYEMVSRDLVIHTLFGDYGLLPNTIYHYVVTAVDSCGNQGPPSSEASITTSPPQLTGWPNRVGKETASSPKIADIDGDAHPDIVVGAEYVYAWHGNGIEIRDGDLQPLTWGILTTEGDNYTATVALGDLDGNVGNEIVGASWNTKEIYIFDHDGNTLPGWPKSTQHLCWASPVLGDLDGDEDLEVIAFDIGGYVYAWHHDGTEVYDWDGSPSTDGIFFKTDDLGYWHVSTPALADIDEDGLVEIVVGAPGDSIYCLNGDPVDGYATSVLGWPVYIGNSGANLSASPAVGDIDDDNHLEVVVPNSAGRVLGLNHDGTPMTNWPQWIASTSVFFVGSPALGDITGDGKLEVVIPSMNGLCYIFRYDGSSLPSWPQSYASGGYTESSPTIADINNDGSPDIILGSEDGRLNAWNADGTFCAGFPIQLSGFIRGTPTVRDLDLDSDIELAASCWDQNIYVWDLPNERYAGYVWWNGFHSNVHNTGWKEFQGASAVGDMAYTYRFLSGVIELSWVVVPDVPSWNVLRRGNEEVFTLLYAGVEPDGNGVVQFTDRSVEEGIVYQYRLEAEGHPDLFIETEAIEIPIVHARLYQNHPNPFNPSTTIPFTVPGGAGSKKYVHLAVYDVKGTLVRTLVSDVFTGGRHEATWDGRNRRGVHVASGIYFAKLSLEGFKATRKLVLLR